MLAGVLFAAATASCGLVWHHSLSRAGGRLGRIDACARYGVGSLVNSFAPAKLGDVVRLGLLLEALPKGGRRRIGRCFVTVQGARTATLAALVIAAAAPGWLAAFAVLPLVGALVLPRDARPLLALSLLAPAAKVAGVALVLGALDARSPLQTAVAVVPALELAAVLPLTPGNVGVASTAAAMALHAGGMPMPDAISAGIVVHGIETAAGVCYGTAATLIVARARFHRTDERRPRIYGAFPASFGPEPYYLAGTTS